MAPRLYFVFGLLFAAASAGSAQTLTLDHFNCYFTQGPPLSQPVELLDQFDTATDPTTGNVPLEHVTELTPFRFCNPVKKTAVSASGVVTTTPITHADAHLVMYRITNQPTTLRLVQVQNQFTNSDGAALITGPAVFLAVPSGKALLASTAPPSLPPVTTVEGELDHFKCYQVFSGPNVGAVVTLQDQFSPLSANGAGSPALVLRPYLFCNPAVKVIPTTSTGANPLAGPPVTIPPTVPAGITIVPILPNPPTPVNDQALHLVCYWIAARPQLQNISVFYDNQFTPIGTLPIAGSDLETLCVPSLKLRWNLLTSSPPGPAPSVRLP
ncbi:MAG TPA: hypothetical protein VGR73_17120 [Bryobacteraceae bacterium]|nr:hypothetical protein [Bryobacteraceae bacterium]